MLIIRKAEREDGAAAWAIRNAAILHQSAGHYPDEALRIWTEGAMPEAFAEEVASAFYVAVSGKRIVGTGTLQLDSGKVDAIFVHPDHMRRGVGRCMLAFLEDLAREQGLDTLHLDATLNAVPFYRACGYQGEAVSTYHSPRGIELDCIPMRKQLGPDNRLPPRGSHAARKGTS